MTTSETELKVTMTEKALRRRFLHKKHVPAEAIVCVLPKHERGRGENLLKEMVTTNEAGWAQYGATGTYRIVDEDAAIKFIEDNGGSVPWGFKNQK